MRYIGDAFQVAGAIGPYRARLRESILKHQEELAKAIANGDEDRARFEEAQIALTKMDLER